MIIGTLLGFFISITEMPYVWADKPGNIHALISSCRAQKPGPNLGPVEKRKQLRRYLQKNPNIHSTILTGPKGGIEAVKLMADVNAWINDYGSETLKNLRRHPGYSSNRSLFILEASFEISAAINRDTERALEAMINAMGDGLTAVKSEYYTPERLLLERIENALGLAIPLGN